MHSSRAIDQILSRHSAFRAFLVARLGSVAEADDVLQNSLLKAWQHAGDLRDEEKLAAWFYQVLRHAIVDHVRHRSAMVARDDAWVAEATTFAADDDGRKAVCQCFEGLLPELKPREAELLRRVELQGEPVADAARAMGLTANNASVTLHRARAALRRKLQDFCGACSQGACLDCDCPPGTTGE